MWKKRSSKYIRLTCDWEIWLSTDIYEGRGWGRELIGEYVDNTIYSGKGWGRSVVGTFENGGIYEGSGFFRSLIGEYKKGGIYKGSGLFKDLVGTYEGDEPGAAAAYLLLMIGRK